MTPAQVVLAYDALHQLERLREKAKEISAVLALPQLMMEISDGDRVRFRLDVPVGSVEDVAVACQAILNDSGAKAYGALLDCGVEVAGLMPRLKKPETA